MKMGKLHSSQLSVDLLKLVNVTTPLQPSFININVFLPPELHRVRLQARTEAKMKGCITYVHSVRLYIKKMKEDQSVFSIEERRSIIFQHILISSSLFFQPPSSHPYSPSIFIHIRIFRVSEPRPKSMSL